MSRTKWASVVCLCVMAGLLAGGCAALGLASKTKVPLPPAVSDAVAKAFPKATIKESRVEEENGLKLYQVELALAGSETTVELAEDGMIVAIETEIVPKDMPKAAADAVAKAAPGATVKEVTWEKERAEARMVKLDAPRVAYEVELAKAGKKGVAAFAADGSVVKPLKWKQAKKEEGKEADEEDSKPADQAALSAKAAAAIKKEFPKAAVGEVKAEGEGDLKVCEVKLQDDAAKVEVEVTPDGLIAVVETEMAAKDLPKAVADAVAKAAAGARIEEVAKVERRATARLTPLAAPKVLFETELFKDGKTGKMEVTVDGQVAEELKWEEAKKTPAKDAGKATSADRQWQDSFPVAKANLASTGSNPYFILQPGYRLVLKDGKDTLTISVLKDTKVVDGVTTRVVEERETKGGQLAEVSRNYFAIDKTTKAVYYFGEDVDMYKDGKVADHGGSWLAGVNGAKFGLMMPGQPKAGERFYQELAAKQAMDRSEIVSVTEEMKTPAGTFQNCLRVRDGSALESGTDEKCYAPGIGLVKDEGFVLVEIMKEK